MANAWGELSWNSGLWGEQSNAIAAPTGLGLNSAQGTTAGYPFPGWGSLSWSSGQWGDVQDFDVQLTGLGLTTNLNNVGVSGEINAGWGRLTWGENAWGIQGDVLITGIGLDVGIGTGSVTIDVQPELAGQQQNISLNNVGIDITVEVFLQNNPLQGLTIAKGTVDAAPDAEVTGNQLNTGLGSLTVYNEQGWGRDRWGVEEWGAEGIWEEVQLNNTNLGLGVTSGERETWGTNAWGGQDTEEWGGNSVTDVDIKTFAAVTGNELTVAEGTVDPSPDATVIGIGLTASVALGSVVEADANVTTTGNALEIAQGQAELDANTIASITGQQLNTSLNSAVAGASAEVSLTGIGLTVSVNSINVQSWQIVNTGSNVTWNIIDTAA
jgi:hypothetical protein